MSRSAASISVKTFNLVIYCNYCYFLRAKVSTSYYVAFTPGEGRKFLDLRGLRRCVLWSRRDIPIDWRCCTEEFMFLHSLYSATCTTNCLKHSALGVLVLSTYIINRSIVLLTILYCFMAAILNRAKHRKLLELFVNEDMLMIAFTCFASSLDWKYSVIHIFLQHDNHIGIMIYLLLLFFSSLPTKS